MQQKLYLFVKTPSPLGNAHDNRRLSSLTMHWRNSCPELKAIFSADELKNMPSEDLQEVAFRYTLDKTAVDQKTKPAQDVLRNDTDLFCICSFCHVNLPRGAIKHHFGVHTSRRYPGQKIRSSFVPFICDLCGFGFKFKKSLLAHWRQHCVELLVRISKEEQEVDDNQLPEIVGSLLKQAEIVAPVQNSEERVKEESDDDEEEVKEEDSEEVEEKPTTSSSSSEPPTISLDRQMWNADNNQLKPQCSDCKLEFFSLGRLRRHQDSYHANPKPIHECTLCQMKFKQNRILMHHLRDGCRAMRVEEPDAIKRKTMPREELMKVIENGQERWEELFEKKKAANLKFIEQFLSTCDKRKPKEEATERPFLQVPPGNALHFLGPGQRVNICDVCKAAFNNPRLLQQHIQLAHSDERTRNQMTITAMSLLPYFKLPEAVFYDISGNEYKFGKYLEKETELAKHFKVIEPGSKVTVEGNNCFIVELHGERNSLLVLNDQEYVKVCDSHGKLKTLFNANPKDMEDIPKLEKETQSIH
ncbi:unnamed protein product [Caenorhabditis sp. 36 PRJEB53466]|nr:unnamed protein product [Caenorhabditis sp. 36 PRJEB53466]